MNWEHISNIQTSFKVIISLFDIVYKSSMTLRSTYAVITTQKGRYDMEKHERKLYLLATFITVVHEWDQLCE